MREIGIDYMQREMNFIKAVSKTRKDRVRSTEIKTDLIVCMRERG